MTEVTVIDYGIGNLLNVCRALDAAGGRVRVVSSAAGVAGSDRLVLPGVGAFGDGMAEMRARGLDEAVLAFAGTGRPFLGVCVGMQMLFDASEEMGVHAGLGLIRGVVKPVPPAGADGTPHRVPHIGWSALREQASWEGSLLGAVEPGERVYFVHSFAPVAAQRDHVLADTLYDGMPVCAAVHSGTLWGCQFHPERSGPVGLRVLRGFLAL